MSWFGRRFKMRRRTRSTPSLAGCSTRIEARAVTIVVPVRNDHPGVARLLQSIEDLPAAARPLQIIVVDNDSTPPLSIPTDATTTLLRCLRRGPAAARNVGWRAASTPWVLFVDADCILTEGTLRGFERAANGALAYAGSVRATDHGWTAEFYEAQKTLVPPAGTDGRPEYLVTANALVSRAALEAVGGFDETFDAAGGEDIDIALRLRERGPLSFAPDAVILHEFGRSFGTFLRRFERYGRGNRQIERLHRVSMVPLPFLPVRRSVVHLGLAVAQFSAMSWGYLRA